MSLLVENSVCLLLSKNIFQKASKYSTKQSKFRKYSAFSLVWEFLHCFNSLFKLKYHILFSYGK